MLDRYLVRLDSLENVYDKNGKAVGFKFAVRNANYRGNFLSLHNGYYIKMDGVVYPREVQKFEVNGKPPRSFEELKKAVYEHWDYDDEGIVYVEKEGGLAPGKHILEFQQSILAAYGYMPTDEEWVKNPPVPGSGAGSDKTTQIVTFELELKEGGPNNG
ncbi:C-glycoside deglycosidase beta subunit domain-containing protein [Cohnella laeviribosi]|uniref:C-glycoside deglycosidase beta subunit domain-containing protein n=1 Tax=Cohnella laeviribosi TaxID=380174 RepID=UPI0003681CFF|nr:DUF6379 domain-containing protein [Cohnella laeviribosi]